MLLKKGVLLMKNSNFKLNEPFEIFPKTKLNTNCENLKKIDLKIKYYRYIVK